MATGEGKSITIVILAIILALQNKNVDILTSSSILAVRDSQEYKSLYKMFNL